ncbi:eCIS core domain-containing protein [Pseudomonas auratipiscis]|uniref:DUF4157 domain-containing protein n=1 Tax=Pseudomonas auratipiscis TaxID=3115853 RepID=A0AB35WLF1_9PSED|nr:MULTISPECIES: DUF4157 domain-containing protein [unclassified Pseudomonas]MEE1865240.1 DUF4157 domain-containing protein [Pseudomonas sp. 120P]MEE1955819.1 DUF4157 domain-containing protein [Pseudomonas sp. 119P]
MRAADLLLGLALVAPFHAFGACPAGQYEVCLGSCICSPFDPGQAGIMLDDLGRIASSTLAAALQQARDSAASSNVLPIPLHIRAQLEPYYDFQVLDAARYKVGDQQALNSANALLQNPDVNAVTLIDIIIFRNEVDAQDNVALWAHELHHVQQYQQWGVTEFAKRYSRDFNAVEAPAYEIQAQVSKDLRERASGQAR